MSFGFDGEWIEHHGGYRPVGHDVVVEVKYLGPPRPDQRVITECFAGFFSWQHTDENDDIIAYRVVA